MKNDDMLSQDEIDALLRGTVDLDSTVDSDKQLNIEDYLSLIERDAIGEIGNICFGNSATALSALLNQKVNITTPHVSIILRERLDEEFPVPYVAVQVKYTSGFSGTNLLVIKQEDAAIIADLMLGGDGVNPSEILDEIRLSAVQEAMNQMMGSSATSMSTIFNKRVNISPPTINMMDLRHGEGEEKVPDSDKLIKVSFRLTIGDLIDSTIMQLLPVSFARNLASSLLNPGGSAGDNREEPIEKQSEASPPLNGFDGDKMQQSLSGDSSRSSRGDHNNPKVFGTSITQEPEANVQPALFSEFEDHRPVDTETKNLDILMDIPLQLTVELGRTIRSVKEILSLSTGSIIELDKLAGEPVDILVNSRLVAKGEVVVIDENFGVRVTDIISQSDRIKKLR